MSKWTVEYDNEVWNDASGDEGFAAWWTVSNEKRSFRCDTEEDANWLAAVLNSTDDLKDWDNAPPVGSEVI